SEPDESTLIVELSEQIDQQFKRIEKLEAALRSAPKLATVRTDDMTNAKPTTLMCTLDEEKNRPFSKEIQNMIRGNAIKYERYKDKLDEIDIREIQEFRNEVEQAFN